LLVDINQIKVVDRARKDLGDLQELADSIKEIGLLQPPVITKEYVLVAGERRIRACQSLGLKQIEVRIVEFEDYLQQFKAERAENAHRKNFTFTEMMELSNKIELIEKERAKQRQGARNDILQNFAGSKAAGNSRDEVAEQIGFGSGEQYRKAKFIAEHAEPEIIQQLNEEKISINKAHLETKAKLDAAERKAKDAEAKAKAEQNRVQDLERKLTEAQNKEPEIIEKTVTVEVVPEKVKDQLSKLKEEQKWYQAKIKQLNEEQRVLRESPEAELRKEEQAATDVIMQIYGFIEKTAPLLVINSSLRLISRPELRMECRSAIIKARQWLDKIENELNVNDNYVEVYHESASN